MTNASRTGLLKTHNISAVYLRLVSRRVPIARQSSIFLYWGNQSPDRKIERLYVDSESKGAWNFSYFQIFLQKRNPRISPGAVAIIVMLPNNQEMTHLQFGG